MSHLTFEEKQAFFAQQIKVQEEAANASVTKSPMPEKNISNRLTVEGKN